MKWRILSFVFVFSFAVGVTAQSGLLTSEGWETVAEGIDYKEFRLIGPNRAFVARMDRNNPNVIIESSIAQGKLYEGKETVSGMASRYDQVVNAWEGEKDLLDQPVIPIGEIANRDNQTIHSWGNRNQVVVAINGSFYDPETGVPGGGMLHSGWYAKPFGDLGGGSGFAWKQSRDVFIGECVHHRENKQILTNLTTGTTQQIDSINFRKRGQQFIIYTPQFDRSSHPNESGVEVLVELTRPLALLPLPRMTVGIVREIRDRKDPVPIPFDHIVLWARGGPGHTLYESVALGDIVGLSLELTHFEGDCSTPHPEDWSKTYASVAGNFIFLKEGVIQSFDNPGATQRHPRTAICYNDAFIFFVVVDGRRDQYSKGMNMTELATFCKESLGATWGINQDGGGSSTMWVNGEVKNIPSDGHERAVANGLMMVVVEPLERSTSFTVGDQVEATEATNIYLGPGTNFHALSSVSKNAEGVILSHINQLNGVLAKGTHWWKVDFSGTVGWMDENALVLTNKPSSVAVFDRWITSSSDELVSDFRNVSFPW